MTDTDTTTTAGRYADMTVDRALVLSELFEWEQSAMDDLRTLTAASGPGETAAAVHAILPDATDPELIDDMPWPAAAGVYSSLATTALGLIARQQAIITALAAAVRDAQDAS
jgi:hypothetical protein